MSHKHNEDRRHKIPKQKFKVTNWQVYNESLRRRGVYDQPLRQTQGMMRSIAKLIGVEITVPDFSTLSRRGKGLVLPPVRRQTAAKIRSICWSTARALRCLVRVSV